MRHYAERHYAELGAWEDTFGWYEWMRTGTIREDGYGYCLVAVWN